jgi:hypothetical protein
MAQVRSGAANRMRERNRAGIGQSKTGISDLASNKPEKIEIENVNHPGHATRVDLDFYQAMKRAFLRVPPRTSPGLTEAEIRERVTAHLPETLSRQGAKAGWWRKAVQLELESKGIVAREKTRPPRWRTV